ncbi:MAG: hypothetical protein U9Q83_06755 [Bacteroidota bacterium]|nr:hypothetical protein [Bacteroidota bacterium]
MGSARLMLNVTVIGTVRDDNGHLQSGNYTVEYKDRNVTTEIIETNNSQISYNVGDHTHLGCDGTLRNGDIMYINFTNTAGTKFCRKIHIHSNENVVILDSIIAKENWGLISSISLENIGDGNFRLHNVRTGDINIFRIYICSESIFENNPNNYKWKLTKTIETVEDFVDISFDKSVRFKAEVETITSGHTSNLSSDILVYNNNNISNTSSINCLEEMFSSSIILSAFNINRKTHQFCHNIFSNSCSIKASTKARYDNLNAAPLVYEFEAHDLLKNTNNKEK